MKKQFETGRSLVEMLGTLAIMGVLSVGGIAAYSTAIKKHKTNEILNEIQKRAIAISSYQGFHGNTAENLLEYEGNDINGLTVSLSEIPYIGSDFAIQIENVDKTLCQNIKNTGLGTSVGILPETCADINTMIFKFKNDLSVEKNNSGTGEFTPSTPGGDDSNIRRCTSLGEKQCHGITVETCSPWFDDGYFWKQTEICEYGCTNGACNTQECTGTERKCWGEMAIMSCENGQWKEWGYTSPSTGNTNVRFKECLWGCKNNACQEECSTTGKKACRSQTIDGVDYWIVLTCTSDGIWDYAKTGIATLACRKADYATCEACINP